MKIDGCKIELSQHETKLWDIFNIISRKTKIGTKTYYDYIPDNDEKNDPDKHIVINFYNTLLKLKSIVFTFDWGWNPQFDIHIIRKWILLRKRSAAVPTKILVCGFWPEFWKKHLSQNYLKTQIIGIDDTDFTQVY